MTTVAVFYDDKGLINRVVASGHSGYSKSGNDIVCAASSSILQTALLGLLKFVNLDIIYKITDGNLDMTIPKDITSLQQNYVTAILETLKLGIQDLSIGYPAYIKLEEKRYVY